MKRKILGVTLIEAIISMWIFAIVVLSVVVCTVGLNSKISQRKLQALNIGRSEMERVKYYIMSGGMSVDATGHSYANGKSYSRLFETVEKRVINVDNDGNPIGYERQDEIKPLHKEATNEPLFYSLNATTANTMSSKIYYSFTAGDAIGPIIAENTPININMVKNAIDYRVDDASNQYFFTLYKGYIVDVKIVPDKTNKNFYTVTVKTGWFDQDARGQSWLNHIEFSSQVYSEVKLN